MKKDESVKDDDWTSYQKSPRYTVGLQKVNQSNCYLDFYETHSLTEAKEKAEAEAAEMGRIAIVYDRKEGIIYRTAATTTVPDNVEKEKPPEGKKKRGRPRKE